MLPFSTLFLLPDENKYGCLNVLEVTHCCKQNKQRMRKRQKFSQHIRHVKAHSRLTEAGNRKHGGVHVHISGGRAACAGQELQQPQMYSAVFGRCHSSAFLFQLSRSGFCKFHSKFLKTCHSLMCMLADLFCYKGGHYSTLQQVS